MSSHPEPQKDFWTADTYGSKVAPFVSRLTQKAVQWLDPQPNDIVLDIGCGEGELTGRLAQQVKAIVGIDQSANMISAMQRTHPHIPAFVVDCSNPSTFKATTASSPTPTPSPLTPNHYTALFSNAALHWILRPPASRQPFFQTCLALLQPGGRFISESGALGNVAEVHAVLWHELLTHKRASDGAPITRSDLEAVDPWYFPSVEEMRRLVEQAGLVWVRGEAELRQTRLTDHEEGGVEGWLGLFADPFAGLLRGGSAGVEWSGVVRRVAETVRRVGGRVDGGVQVNYVRLRFEARRPVG